MSLAHAVERARRWGSSRRLVVLGLLALSLVVASAPAAAPAPAHPAGSAGPGDVTIVATGLELPGGITTGPDGNLWFTGRGTIHRMTPAGLVTSFPDVGITGSGSITSGPDGNLWFTDEASIGRITPAGVITLFSDPGLGILGAIAAGADGNLWFTNGNSVGRITTAGVVSFFQEPGSFPVGHGIAAGSDGNVWFPKLGFFSNSGWHGESIGRITPAGAITLFPDGTSGAATPSVMTSGPDGNVWFATYRGGGTHTPEGVAIARITPDGVVTSFTDPGIQLSAGIATGPDGNLWFTNATGVIGRITPTGELAWFSGVGVPPGRSITAGPDGDVWFTAVAVDGSGAVGRVELSGTGSAPPAPEVTAPEGAPTTTAAVLGTQLPATGSDRGRLGLVAGSALLIGGLALGLARGVGRRRADR